MAQINPGNRLYLYQLLSREIGVGRQTLLPRVEEALEADGADIIRLAQSEQLTAHANAVAIRMKERT